MFRKFFKRTKKDQKKGGDVPPPPKDRPTPIEDEPDIPMGMLPKKFHDLSSREWKKRKTRMRMAKESRRKNRK